MPGSTSRPRPTPAAAHTSAPAAGQASRAPLAISMGDPCGIGPEIVVRALATPALADDCIVYGDPGLLQATAAWLQLPVPPRIEAVTRLHPLPSVGRPDATAGDAAYRYIVAAAQSARAGHTRALVTAPISKAALQAAGHDWPGHTELLADLAGGGGLRQAIGVHLGAHAVAQGQPVGDVFLVRLGGHLDNLGILGHLEGLSCFACFRGSAGRCGAPPAVFIRRAATRCGHGRLPAPAS